MRACTSSNSRAFSIAITAWSAKVCSSCDLLVGERAGLDSGQTAITPIGVLSRSIGTHEHAAKAASARAASRRSAVSCSVSSTSDNLRRCALRRQREARPSATGKTACEASIGFRVGAAWYAARCTIAVDTGTPPSTGPTSAFSTLSDGLEHRLHVRGRAG